MFPLQNARQLATFAAQSLVKPGDRVVDATMGNGHDSLMLAGAVGEQGHVYAFDIQPRALENTRERLGQAGLLDRVSLHLCCHSRMEDFAPPQVRLVMFNLGWLPGADKAVTSHPETTLQALGAAMRLVERNGVVLMTLYPGHEAGRLELEALVQYVQELPPAQWSVLRQMFPNYGPAAPQNLLLQKN